MFDSIKVNSDLAKWIVHGPTIFLNIILPLLLFIFSIGSSGDITIFDIKTDLFLGLAIVCWSIFLPGTIWELGTSPIRMRSVPTDRWGLILWGDKPLLEIGPGPVFFISKLFRLETHERPEGSRRIILTDIETGNPREVKYSKLGLKAEDYENNELNAQLTVGVQYTLFWKIKKGELHKYKMNLGSEEKFFQLVEDRSREEVSIEFSKRTPAIINAQRRMIANSIKKFLQYTSDCASIPDHGWGLELNVSMIDLILPAEIVDGLKHKVMAVIDQYLATIRSETSSKVTRIEAEAEAFRQITVGKSEAEVKKFLGEADALALQLSMEAKGIGYGRIAKELKLKEEDLRAQIFQLENLATVFSETMKNSQYTYLGSEISQVFGFMSVLRGALDKIKMPTIGPH